MRTFTLDDIAFWQEAFAQFGIDISGLVEEETGAVRQFNLTQLDHEVEEELQRDADHQRKEWIIRDRAYEAFGLVESDGANIGIDGTLSSYAYKSKRGKNSKAFINLVKGNVDRVSSQLEAANLGVSAVPEDPDDNKRIQAFIDMKDAILENNNFKQQYQSYVRDGVQFGSGYLKIRYDFIKDNPDLASYANVLQERGYFTEEEFALLKNTTKGHLVDYVPTFECIHYRGAKGKGARSIHDDRHRWFHRVRQIALSKARDMFPYFKNDIYRGLSRSCTDTNPYVYQRDGIDDTVSLKTTYIRFPVRREMQAVVKGIDGMRREPIKISRHAIARIDRIEGLGIVDIDIDEYNHHKFPFANWVYSDSYRHSKGIGIVKYGRDPQVVHNMLHNGMLHMVGTMAKGNGWVDSRLNVTQEQLQKQTEPGQYTQVDIPENHRDKSLSDFIVTNKPPQFQSVYADLMGIESRAVDDAMNVPNVYKGKSSGSSGLQEQVLRQQADMTHNFAQASLQQSLHPFGQIIFSNIQQFEKGYKRLFVADKVTGENRMVEVNKYIGWTLRYDPTNQLANNAGFVPQPTKQINKITNLRYSVDVSTQSIVPTQPSEKAAFYNNFFMQTVNYLEDPKTRRWLKAMNDVGYRLPMLSEALEDIEGMEQQQQEQQMKMAQQQQKLQEQKEQAELQLEKKDRQLDEKEINQDFFIEQQKLMLEMKKIQKDMKKEMAQLKQQNQEGQQSNPFKP